ncbi:hypothetical protein RRG08_011588 [Elysia crispata]|uniref:Uncharacterized protein n=1 Tax=Elysia crispata TaxID=231223 RepID=A0AAE1CJV0_9GAST|nr:hypothetical protein RRG08_011588 [Elysia crispata]
MKRDLPDNSKLNSHLSQRMSVKKINQRKRTGSGTHSGTEVSGLLWSHQRLMEVSGLYSLALSTASSSQPPNRLETLSLQQ